MIASFVRRSTMLAVAAGFSCVTGFAAEPQTSRDDDKSLEEVVVTAQKRAERVVDVPVVINSVSAQELTDQNLSGIRDYYSRVPGLSYDGDKTYSLSLRGITTGNATNPTLSILVDDVQYGASTQAGLGNSVFPDFDPAMLERIEVLHGPQGTLYGAASLGGLIKYVTRQPDTEKFSARVEGGIQSVKGGDTGWGARGSVNIPLMSERVALRISGFDREDSAYIDNVQPGNEGKDINNVHIRGGHAALLLKPADGVSITLSALQQKRDADFRTSTLVNEDANGVPTFEPIYGRNNVSLASTSDFGDQKLYTARAVFDFGGVELTSVTAYGKSRGTNLQDLSAVFTFMPFYYNSPGAITFINDAQHTNKFSQELRLNGRVAEQADWRVGVFYTREKSSVDQALTLFDASGAFLATPFDGLGPNSYRERAAFADVVYHATEKWDVQGGVRYAKNKQKSGGFNTIDPVVSMFFGVTGPAPDLDSRDNSFTWAFSPVYHLNPDVVAYLRVATGYRPGGPNGLVPGVADSYGPDKVTNYEVGFKGIAADRRFSWETALFDIEWKDVQLQDTNASNQFTYTTNGGKARSRGAELAADWKPATGLSIGATVTLMDAQLTQTLPIYDDIDSLIGSSGDRLPASAKLASNLSVQQDFPLSGELSGFVGAEWIYVGDRRSAFQLNVHDPGDPSAPNSATPRFKLPSYSQLDLRAGLNYGADWHLNVFVRNLTDKKGVVTADNRNGTSVTSVNFLRPRTIGFSLAKEF
jgi:outer membrane receptor protein involved in Fe transport